MTNSTVPTVRPGDRVFEEARKYGFYPWARQEFFRGLLVQDVQLLKPLEAQARHVERAIEVSPVPMGTTDPLGKDLIDLKWQISAVWARAFEVLKYIDSLPDSDFFQPNDKDPITHD